MDMRETWSAIREGTEVFGADGDKVGNVTEVHGHYIVVEKGWFFPTDYYIPREAFAAYEDGKLFLNVEKDVALNQGWDTIPAPPPTIDADADAMAAGGSPVDTWPEREAGFGEPDQVPPAYATERELEATERVVDETVRVPVYEEELTPTKTVREVGGARIEKEVVAEEQTIDVPVTEERIRVTRRQVDRPIDPTEDATAFEEVIADVPVRVEEAGVEKHARVAEEIDIEKERIQRTEQVGGTVRREEVRITETDPESIVDERTPGP